MEDLALFIHFVHKSTTLDFIAKQFEQNHLGFVHRIEWTEHSSCLENKQVFVFLRKTESAESAAMLAALASKKKEYVLNFSGKNFWKIRLNKSKTANAPQLVHMDLEVTVPAGTSIEDIYTRLDMDNIGAIAGHTVSKTQPKSNQTRVIIVLKYWHRSLGAIKLQNAIFADGVAYINPFVKSKEDTPELKDDSVKEPEPDAGPVEPEAGPETELKAEPIEPQGGPVEPDEGPVEPDAGPIEPDAGPVEPDAGPAEPDAGPETEPEAEFSIPVWRIRESPHAPKFPGVSPYIWYNTRHAQPSKKHPIVIKYKNK